MLDEARIKVAEKKYENVCLIKADDKTVWNEVNLLFDRITTTEVLQYLTFEQIDGFVDKASKYLNDEGKIVFLI